MVDDQDIDVDIDDDDDDQDDDWQPLSRENEDKLKRALKKANDEAKKHRLKLRDFVKKSATDDKDGNAEVERERIRTEVTEKEEGRWKTKVVRQAAKAALLEAGLTGDATKLARLVDEKDVTVDEDGDIEDGLDEQIDSIKEDYPDLFEDRTQPRTRRSTTGRIDGSDKSTRQPAKKLTSAEKIAQSALRKTAR